ncbi:hypothetical protein Vretifemale_9109 [Volvox reticuliferus]|uniref:Uncharacterized protein n=1 Tax=Volvox reticuliferus TaxID=1737510 RepID=A0A8J4CF73_9CHLO|nr:hypothetical protein Vretifemale_9109 [Volvox reticuliferus]
MDTPSAIITGAASGIGKEIAAQLASCGCQLTLLDVDRSALLFTSQELSRRYPAVSIRSETLDVTQAAAQRAAFRAHVETYGGLQLVVLNAGIGERGPFFDPANEGWQNTLDVDLTAVLHGIKIAAEMMSGGGAILAVASAGAFFPMPVAPVYAAAKAGVAHFVRSSARSLASRRPPLRLMALCPEFVETPLVTRLMKEDPELARQLLGSLDIKLLSPAFVASVAADMLADNSGAKYKPGAVALIRQDGEVVQPHARNGGKVIGGSGGKHRAGALGGDGDRAAAIQAQRRVLAVWAVRGLPLEYKKIVIATLSSNFRQAARLVTVPLGPLLRPPRGQLLVRRVYAGINASDINYSSGRWVGGTSRCA